MYIRIVIVTYLDHFLDCVEVEPISQVHIDLHSHMPVQERDNSMASGEYNCNTL